MDDSWCYKDTERKFRLATQEEIQWLDACIKAKKYLTKSEAMKKETTDVKYIIFTPEQQQATIKMACSTWKEILAKEFGATIVLEKNKYVSEEKFKEYLDASTQEQKEKFKEMFPEYFNPKPDIKKDQLIYVKSGSIWKMRFFSHWDDDKVACYMNQQKEGWVSSWQEYSLTNPLEE